MESITSGMRKEDSAAYNQVAGDTNGRIDIFVHNVLKLFSDVQFSHFAFDYVLRISKRRLNPSRPV